MLDFMEYIQRSFSEASQWNRDNSYSALTDTAQGRDINLTVLSCESIVWRRLILVLRSPRLLDS